MGTQQILLIVLSVIIVGIAVAVGIAMFNNQAINSAEAACISDMSNFSAIAMAYYRTPSSQGGSSYGSSNWDADHIAAYVGIGYDSGTSATLVTDNGTFVVSLGTGTIVFTCTPKEPGLAAKHTAIVYTYTINTGAGVVTYT